MEGVQGGEAERGGGEEEGGGRATSAAGRERRRYHHRRREDGEAESEEIYKTSEGSKVGRRSTNTSHESSFAVKRVVWFWFYRV